VIADDNAINREIAREMVVSIGAIVDEADSGAVALAAVRAAWDQARPFKYAANSRPLVSRYDLI
jgi:CheY-like chemotaxis protein